MHKLIKELAAQVNDQSISGEADGMVVTADDLIMFAELIVNECASLTDDHWDISGDMIKEHFGVACVKR
jgi:hypothetical protein